MAFPAFDDSIFEAFYDTALTFNGAEFSCALYDASGANADDVSEDGLEVRRYAALPYGDATAKIKRGACVEIDGVLHLVLAVVADPLTSVDLSLSAPFTPCRSVAYSGTRASRAIIAPAAVLFSKTDTALEYPDPVAPSESRVWVFAILRRDWQDETPPQLGDTITLADGDRRLRVFEVRPQTGAWIIRARPLWQTRRLDD